MTEMLQGLMQNDFQLTLNHVLGRMRSLNEGAQVVTLQPDGSVQRISHAALAERVDRLARVLGELGVEQGDRVASFAWNNQRHMELYMAAPCTGAVLHTLNVRLFAEQLTYIVNHAEDRVIFVDDSLVPVLEQLAPSFETVRHYVVMGDGDSGLAAERAALRGAARAGRRRLLRLPRARRAPGGGALLHERHHRQPQGRALLAPLDQPALLDDADDRGQRPRRAGIACWRWCRCSTPTPGDCPTARRSRGPT